MLTSDPTFTKRVLAARSRYTRGPWFDSIRIDPHVPNIVSERDEKSHNRLRLKLSASVRRLIQDMPCILNTHLQYNNRTITAIESAIDEQLVQWIHLVSSTWCSASGQCTAFEIGKRIQFLTVDIITSICLGKPLGCVTSDSDKYDFLKTVEQGNRVCQHLSVILELNSLIYYVTKIPFLGSLIVPKSTDRSGVGRIMGVGQVCDG